MERNASYYDKYINNNLLKDTVRSVSAGRWGKKHMLSKDNGDDGGSSVLKKKRWSITLPEDAVQDRNGIMQSSKIGLSDGLSGLDIKVGRPDCEEKAVDSLKK